MKPETLLGLISADATEILQSAEDPTGGHNEIMVILNFNENTTIDRDRLIADGNPQVLVVDVWYIDKLARAMARGPEAVQQYESLVHAMMAYQVATYITLCNGKHRFAMIRESEPAKA